MLRSSKFSSAKSSTLRRSKEAYNVPQITRRIPQSSFELLMKININPKTNKETYQEKQKVKASKGNRSQSYYKHTYEIKGKTGLNLRKDLPCQEITLKTDTEMKKKFKRYLSQSPDIKKIDFQGPFSDLEAFYSIVDRSRPSLRHLIFRFSHGFFPVNQLKNLMQLISQCTLESLSFNLLCDEKLPEDLSMNLSKSSDTLGSFKFRLFEFQSLEYNQS
eukprot:TRINITY_DN12093_c0_g4_i1.p3 TRINITY_DN12093_c0_g4~~TRINITY_DN12093_c0_g4_i1.p3  ORF type:complete len:218 (+),score=20.00 TRINITY_DN12093_c0_g4_i1:27-680(+)